MICVRRKQAICVICVNARAIHVLLSLNVASTYKLCKNSFILNVAQIRLATPFVTGSSYAFDVR